MHILSQNITHNHSVQREELEVAGAILRRYHGAKSGNIIRVPPGKTGGKVSMCKQYSREMTVCTV